MSKITKEFLALSALLFFSTSHLNLAHAQETYEHTDADVNHLARDEVSQRLTVLDFGLMGDAVDKYTGTLVFNQTDVSLPGNSNLEVAIRRIATNSHMTNHKEGFFGDWILDVPNISSLSAYHYSSGNFACVGDMFEDEEAADVITDEAQIYLHNSAFWDGMKLNIPGQGAKVLLGNSRSQDYFDQTLWEPFDLPPGSGAGYSSNAIGRVTKDHWVVTCINPRSAGDPSVDPWNAEKGNHRFDGYVAISPDGTRYRMDKLVVKQANDYEIDGGSLERNIGRFYATEMTDVHGNWVRYQWSADGKLLSIYSNDGRAISLSYHPGSNLIAKVTANGRNWHYSYRTLSNSTLGKSIDNSLYRVLQPDNKSWEYNLEYLLLSSPRSDRQTSSNGVPYSFLTNYVKHPYGVRADYEFGTVRHARKNGDLAGWGNDYSYRRTNSVFSKTLSGASIPTSTWNYDYEEFSSSTPFSGTDTKTTTVTRPNGSRQVLHFFRDFEQPWKTSPLIGRASKEEVFSATGVLLEETNYTYELGERMGRENVLEWNDANSQLAQKAYQTSKTVSRDGDTYTTEKTYGTNQNSASYTYHQPVTVKTYSNVSTTPRETVATYTHKKDKWVIGLTKSATTNGRLMSSYTHDSFGRVANEYKHGALVSTFGYHSNPAYKGALYSIKDALNRTSYLLNYTAGTPKNIRRPDNSQDEQIVDSNGWIRSQTDFRGYKTSYQYDKMGRLTRIIPEQSLYGWRETKIRYSFGSTNIVQHISDPDEEDYQETITYDQLFRPVLEYKVDWYTEWQSYVNTRYGANGEVEFKSQPSTNRYETKGVNYTYDGLDRVKTEAENVSPYATTRFDYLGSHQKRITDPNNNATTYRYSGYEGPGKGKITYILQPMGVTTQVSRNVHDQVNYVRQYGYHNGYSMNQYNHYYYDSRQRLCRHRTPEGGDTVNYYDNANRITWTARGQSSRTSCSQSSVPSNQRVSYTYDLLDREKITNYPDSSPDVYTTYDANGNVLTKNRGGANWTYTYNELNKLTSENLSVDGRSFNTSYIYNYAGFVSTRTTPDNRTIYLGPDNFGGSTNIRSGSTWYASDISFHPNRQLKNIQFGNGFYHDVTLNSRQLPYRLYTRKGSTRSLLLYHNYDSNKNITRVLDYSDRSRTYHKYMTYDALNRLKTANASNAWGNGTFEYDPLGNLRQKVLGNRTVNVHYNSLNRVSYVSDAGAGRSYSYDARGNVTNNGERSFTYDQSNQPTYMSGAGTYRYDGNHKRVKSVVNGKTTYSVYGLNGDLLYTDKVTDNKKIVYIQASGKTIVRLENGVPSYTHNDLLGSSLSSTTSTGGIKWREQYTPFGEKWLNPQGNRDDEGFTGHVQDDATGLTYMQARYYDPDIGRFLSIDPVGFRISKPALFNRYSYAGNNPYRYTDPDGRDSTDHNTGDIEDEEDALDEIVATGERPDDFIDGLEDYHFVGIVVPGEDFDSPEEWMEHRLKYNAWYALQSYGANSQRQKRIKTKVKGGKAGKTPDLTSQEAWFFLHILNGLRDIRYPYMQQMPEGVGIGEPFGPFDPTMVF